jgi:spore germination protein GerM
MHDHKPVEQPLPPQPERQSRRRFPLYFAASCSAIAFIAGSGLAWWNNSVTLPPQPLVTSNALKPTKPDVSQPNPPQPSAESSLKNPTKAPIEQSVQIYWLKTVGNEIELAAAPVALKEDQPNVVLKAAFDKLLQGSTDPTLTSTIPANTRLQKLEIKPDGIHVDLSTEFTSGGGSTAMMGRVGQVIYTATTLDPNAAVWISINDEPLSVLGGEGLELEQPMTRQAFDQSFSL